MDDQVRVEDWPAVMLEGNAPICADGKADVTITVAEALAVPPLPVQATEYAVLTVGKTGAEPLTAPPVEKPVPAQEVALVDDQARVEDWPEIMLDGEAVRVAMIQDEDTEFPVIVGLKVFASWRI